MASHDDDMHPTFRFAGGGDEPLKVADYLQRIFYDVPIKLNYHINDHVRGHQVFFDRRTRRWCYDPNKDNDMGSVGSFVSDDGEDFGDGPPLELAKFMIKNKDLVLTVLFHNFKLREKIKKDGAIFNKEIKYWIIPGNIEDFDRLAEKYKKLIFDVNQPRIDLPGLDCRKDATLRRHMKQKGAKWDFDNEVWFVPAGFRNSEQRFAKWMQPAAAAA